MFIFLVLKFVKMSLSRFWALVKDDGHFVGRKLEDLRHGVRDDDGLVGDFENRCHDEETKETFPHFKFYRIYYFRSV